VGLFYQRKIFHLLQFSSKRLSELAQVKDANAEKQTMNAKRLSYQTRKNAKKNQLYLTLEKLKLNPAISPLK